mmetsp:Transcript_5173/g.12426  ORF Transcript_5173/g.12426 Transcript_5173/m.12426 type:complete len:663 (+) Transcript_5173:102-2090(+)
MTAAHRDVAGLLHKYGYAERRKVGEGSFGKALLVEGNDGTRLICKMVDVSKASPKELQDADKESRLLSSMQHAYIVRYRETFRESGWLCILMDFCEGGDLTAQIQSHRRAGKIIAENQVLTWFTQAILALRYIHERHILHRDLKPSNFFLMNGNLIMGDFGIAKELACTIANAKTQIGTPYYLSPELCQERPYAWPSDIWAMGCILYEMCALKVPFDAPNISALVKGIVSGRIPSVPPTYSPVTRQLCADILHRAPDRRPSADAILKRDRMQEIITAILPEELETRAPVEPAAGANLFPEADSIPKAAPVRLSTDAGAVDSDNGQQAMISMAGNYTIGDLVEYHSDSHHEWLPATVIDTDRDGRIVIDLKPRTWMTKDKQAAAIRPRKAPPLLAPRDSPRVVAAASPARQRYPSRDQQRGPVGGCPQTAASPSAGPRSASPWRQPLSGRAQSPFLGAAASVMQAVAYSKNDLVEYYSNTHGTWLPAIVVNIDGSGRIVLDLKPNTWLSKEEQTSRVRRRVDIARVGGQDNRPLWREDSAREAQASNVGGAVQRSPSTGSRGGGILPVLHHSPSRQETPKPRRSPSSHSVDRAMGLGHAPSARLPSPREHCAQPGNASPCSGAGAAISNPRSDGYSRPPGMPRGSIGTSLSRGGAEVARNHMT